MKFSCRPLYKNRSSRKIDSRRIFSRGLREDLFANRESVFREDLFLYNWSLEASHADQQVVLELRVTPVLEEFEIVGILGGPQGGSHVGAGGDGGCVVEAGRVHVEAVALPRPEVLE